MNGTARERGKVKWFNTEKGYGFIQPDSGGKDVFLHIRDLPDGIEKVWEEQVISFLRETTQKGVRAISIELG